MLARLARWLALCPPIAALARWHQHHAALALISLLGPETEPAVHECDGMSFPPVVTAMVPLDHDPRSHS